MPDLLCMGEPMLEFNAEPPGADGRLRYLEGHGGDTSNAAIAAARSGAAVGYITAIGTDQPGEQLHGAVGARGRGRPTPCAATPMRPTGIYVVTHDSAGHHFTFYRTGSAAARTGPPTCRRTPIRRARILHVSGISQAISDSACDAVFHAIGVARQAGVRVSYDTNLRLRLWPAARAAAVIHAGIAMADIALPSLDDATALTGLADPDAVLDLYLRLCPLVLLKCGAEGCIVATRDARTRIPAHRVEAVDATGAGDTFAGAFLARTLAGEEPVAAARYANAAAALSTTGYGAVAPIPRPAAVAALLARAVAGGT